MAEFSLPKNSNIHPGKCGQHRHIVTTLGMTE